ncbi:MAG TPA: aspartate dehydrogenase domain-containing protein [bacterium]|nr:aspartate dehydrogenase domain-containing protein [bacterium]
MASRRPVTRLGIVGCGAIGSLVARTLDKKNPAYRVTALLDTHAPQAVRLARTLSSRPKVCTHLSELIRRSDLVLEAASVKAALPVARAVLGKGKSLVLMSAGACLLHGKELAALAKRQRTKLYIPSGAVSGVDGIRSARALGTIHRIRITSRKPPRGFLGAPGLTSRQRKSLATARRPMVLYQGGVRGAIRAFPANVNVAATTAMASGLPNKLRVTVIADPGVKTNQHEIQVEGSFGRMVLRTENVPSPANPKTSALAVQAALALLERITAPVEIGS